MLQRIGRNLLNRAALYRLLQKPPAGWLLLLQAAALLLSVRVLLPVLSLHHVRCFAATLARFLAWAAPAPNVALILQAFRTLERRLKFPCLTNAIAAQSLMHAYGHATHLRVGAMRISGSFTAHAWLESDHQVLVGGPEELVRQYSPFPDMGDLSI